MWWAQLKSPLHLSQPSNPKPGFFTYWLFQSLPQPDQPFGRSGINLSPLPELGSFHSHLDHSTSVRRGRNLTGTPSPSGCRPGQRDAPGEGTHPAARPRGPKRARRRVLRGRDRQRELWPAGEARGPGNSRPEARERQARGLGSGRPAGRFEPEACAVGLWHGGTAWLEVKGPAVCSASTSAHFGFVFSG